MPSVDLASKKRRVNDSYGDRKAISKAYGSRIFSPFRTVGLVTDRTAFAVTSLGQSFLITTVVDRSFHIYDASNLHLLFVSSPQAPSQINCIYSRYHYVYAAWDRSIGIYKRGKLEHTMTLSEGHGDTSPVSSIVLFGEYLCVGTTSAFHVYKTDPKNSTDVEFYTSFNIPKSLGPVVELCHLPTYLNKVLVVTEHSMLIYNVRSGKLLHTSDEFASSQITTVEVSPVLDVVAVATSAGEIHLYNVRQARVLFSFSLDDRISTLSFRTDNTAHLAVGTAAGDIFIYDLNGRRRVHSVRNAHRESSGGLSRVHYLNGQPILVSNGGDNLVQELVFDPSITSSTTASAITSPPRVLRSRGGHSLAPTCIEFTDDESHFVLSSSLDKSLWSFSLRKDSQSHEFSQRTSATVNGKRASKLAGTSTLTERFSEITALAYQQGKQSRWDNIVTAHKNLDYARTWSGSRGIVGKYHLHTVDGGLVKSVAVTQCGNFGIVGSSKGGIGVYNLQSGILRRRIVAGANGKAVTGVVVDALNSVIISCSLDGNIRFHDFHSGKLIKKLDLDSSALELKLHRSSSLLAVSLDNLCIVVIDIETHKVVRELWGHTNRITSLDFNPDGRWIMSASLDSTIRTWDLPTGGCIDAVRVASVVTCLRVSPNGDWLATAHVQGSGIQLWTQRAQFHQISTRHVSDEEIAAISMPNSSGEGGANILDGAFEDEMKNTGENYDDDPLLNFRTQEQLSDDLATLSLLPRSKFNTLIHLEAIKQRNKPREAPKAPEKAPFFLTPGSLDKDERRKTGDQQEGLKPKFGSITDSESDFTRLLREQDYEKFIAHLKMLSPAATDLEIRSLDILPPLDEFISFINALTHQLSTKRDYELVQAWMAMLLRVHGDVILEHGQSNPDLADSLTAWEVQQQQEAQRLDELIKYCSGVLNYLRTG